MPRKFLGQRIQSDVDFLRPSSLTLTVEELDQIPLIPNGMHQDKTVHKKLSSKFGGTMKLRKRLESVPELFLHDFKKSTKRKKKTANVIKGTEYPLTTVLEQQLFPHSRNRSKNFLVSNPVILSMEVEKVKCPSLAYNEVSKGNSETLFDEIISAYAAVAPSTSVALNSEIDRVLDHVTKQQKGPKINAGTCSPTIVEANDATNFLPAPSTPMLEPTSSPMADRISSPEYTGASASDRWSSGDEFSDLGSIMPSIALDTNEDGYCTAMDSSLRSISVASNTKFSSMASHDQVPKKCVSARKLQTIQVKPKIFHVDEDDEKEEREILERQASVEDLRQLSLSSFDMLQILQDKIEKIDIVSCSSSIYSDL